MGIIDNLENLAAGRALKANPQPPVADVSVLRVVARPAPPPALPPPSNPPAPCPACTSPAFWQSAYDDRLRCSICNPWPSLSLVRQRWAVVVAVSEPGKPFAWERWEDGPHLELRQSLAVNCHGGRKVEAAGKDGVA